MALICRPMFEPFKGLEGPQASTIKLWQSQTNSLRYMYPEMFGALRDRIRFGSHSTKGPRSPHTLINLQYFGIHVPTHTWGPAGPREVWAYRAQRGPEAQQTPFWCNIVYQPTVQTCSQMLGQAKALKGPRRPYNKTWLN